MQKLARVYRPQLSLLLKKGSVYTAPLPSVLKPSTIATNHVFFSTQSTAAEHVTPSTTSAATGTAPPSSTIDPALLEFRQHLDKATTATSLAKSTPASPGSFPSSSKGNSSNGMIHHLWHQYEKVQDNNGLTREDYASLRSLLWKHKLWGSEDRILQLLDNMKRHGHDWALLEYNEFFLVKLYQAKYQDILDMYNGDAFLSSGVKLSPGSFNAILATYIKLDREQDAGQLIKEALERWGLAPDIRDFDRVMHRCLPKDAKVVAKGREWIARYGFDQVKVVDTNLIHLFRDKRVDDGLWIYERLTNGNKRPALELSTCTILIKNLMDANKTRLVADIYDDMIRRGLKSNPAICSAMLTLYAHRRKEDKAEMVVRDMVMAGHPMDEVIYNQLIKVYFKARNNRKALQAFEEIQRNPALKVNEIILNTVVDGLVMNREIQAANHLYKQILATSTTSIKPDMVTFNTLFKGFVKAKEYGLAGGVIKDMYKYQCEPDTVTYTTLIDSIFEYKQPKTTTELMGYVNGMGMAPNIYTFNAMINGWVRQKNMDEAEHTLQLLKTTYQLTPTIHTMTNMIQGYVEVFNLSKVMQTFQDTVSQGIKPDRAAYNFLITGFLDHDRLDDAVTCLQHMRKAKLNPTTDTWNILLENCAKNRRWQLGATLVKEIELSGFKVTNPSLRRNYLLLKSHT